MKVIKKVSGFISAILLQVSFIFCQTSSHDFTVLKGSYLGQKEPGLTPEIFAPGIFSLPETSEWSSSFSSDGKEFYFQRIIENEYDFQVKIIETKLIGEKWTQPAEVKFTKGYNENRYNGIE